VWLLLTGCSSAGYDSSWTNPEAGEALDLVGKPVAVFLLIPSEDMRRAVENMLAEAVSERGVKGIPGNTLITRAQLDDREDAKRRLAEDQIVGGLLLRPIGGELQARYVPGRSYYANLGYEELWGYWSVWGDMLHEPGHYEVDRKIYVETLYYSVPRNSLLWGGVTSVESEDDLGETFGTVVTDTGREMRRAGVLPR
jgi:hypothetical protein